jgi:putative peptidoglycan lipid II flippase
VWGRDSLLLLGAAVASGLVAWGLAQAIAWPTGLGGQLLECSLAGGAALLVYGLAAGVARVPEMDQLLRQLRGQLKARLPFAR